MMIDPDHLRLSIVRQCALVSISRASFYRQPADEDPENLELMRLIDEAFLEMPEVGNRFRVRPDTLSRPYTSEAEAISAAMKHAGKLAMIQRPCGRGLEPIQPCYDSRKPIATSRQAMAG
jgi:hypothetical protein